MQTANIIKLIAALVEDGDNVNFRMGHEDLKGDAVFFAAVTFSNGTAVMDKNGQHNLYSTGDTLEDAVNHLNRRCA